MHSDPLIIWAVSDGRAGMENQALGLAEAIARKTCARIKLKRIKISWPFEYLPKILWGDALARISAAGDDLAPPYPHVFIGCGRRTVPLAIAMKKKALQGRGPFVIQTQAPKAPSELFDLVIAPDHDLIKGDNVLSIIGAPNRLDPGKIAQDAARLAAALPPLQRPITAVLLGGPSKSYQMPQNVIEQIVAVLEEAMDAGFGLLVTPSRRTPEALLEALRPKIIPPKGWLWDGKPLGTLANPYFGMLGLAEKIFVTEETTNMITDAAFTGKPVALLRLEGGAPKWDRFHASLTMRDILRPEMAVEERWTAPPLRETDRAADLILERLAQRGIISAPA